MGKHRSTFRPIGCAMALIASQSFANVHGQIVLSNGAPAANAVIWFKGAEHGVPLKAAVMDQRNLTFVPHVMAVTVGTTVSFPNSDTVFHNVFAEFKAKRFDLGMYPRGATKKVKFDRPGLVALLCSVHSNMSAYIVVVDTPYYAVADRQGRFSVAEPQEGSVRVEVWHESGQRFEGPFAPSASGVQLRLAR